MSNYSDDPKSVRVDFWKPSGKWYDTEAVTWDRYLSFDKFGGGTELIHDTFKRCLREQLGGRMQGMVATCLEPYHENSHPLMVKEW